MITYSTNWMGPISLSWYEERGLLKEGSVEPTAYYSAGRIDIRGLELEKFYSGWDEYGLRPMHTEDWVALTDWLSKLTTETKLSHNELIEMFENNYGKKIRWMQ